MTFNTVAQVYIVAKMKKALKQTNSPRYAARVKHMGKVIKHARCKYASKVKAGR
jgi:hypothetical protein